MPQIEKFKVALAALCVDRLHEPLAQLELGGLLPDHQADDHPGDARDQPAVRRAHEGKIKLALLILLAGVGVATVTDVELRPLGLVYGALAVLTTAVFQIWQGTKQKEFEISGTQLQAAVAPWQTVQALVAAALTEERLLEAAVSDTRLRLRCL